MTVDVAPVNATPADATPAVKTLDSSTLSFVPVRCGRTKPPPGPTTADADFIAIDDVSTERFLCKGQSKTPLLPATEWICAHLAKVCGLPVPQIAIVELASSPGTYYFGSRWEAGALDFSVASGKVSNPEIFSRTFAADLFTHNVDRHLGNFLYLDIAGEVVARIIDFSRALYFNGWPLPALPMDAKTNTVSMFHYSMAQYPGAYEKPTALLETITLLPADWMKATLGLMPDAWLPENDRHMLEAWWAGPDRAARVAQAEACLP